ncbi:MAG: sialate O-acetylesterase, partial [Bacteroidota bacterium]
MKTSLLTTLRLVIGFSVLGGYGCSPKDTLPGDEVWVFLLAGQSNMAGRDQAEEEDRETHPRVWTIDSLNNFKLAEQPLHFYEPDRPGVDCGLAFGTELVENLEEEVTILILPTAVGGTRIDQWLGDSTFRGVTLLSNFKEKAKLGRRHGKIKGILWHQGEDDAPFSDNIEVHDEQLGKLFDEFRSICRDRKLPIFV